MLYLWLKVFHIVAVISWMAGILYFWRLLVYHAMETEPVVISRFLVMERRLNRAIMTPAMIATVVLGIALILIIPVYLQQSWLLMKLILVAFLLVNHGLALRAARRLAIDPRAYDHKFFRVMNEVPTLLMIFIVILVILKPVLW